MPKPRKPMLLLVDRENELYAVARCACNDNREGFLHKHARCAFNERCPVCGLFPWTYDPLDTTQDDLTDAKLAELLG